MISSLNGHLPMDSVFVCIVSKSREKMEQSAKVETYYRGVEARHDRVMHLTAAILFFFTGRN